MDFFPIMKFVSASVTATSTTSGRPFTAAFVITLMGRLIYEGQIPILQGISGMSLPFWMLNWSVIGALGLLMIGEWLSDSNDDLRVMLEDLKTNLVKPGVNLALQFGLVQGQSREVLKLLAQVLPEPVLAWLLSVGPGVAVASTEAISLSQQAQAGGILGWLVAGIALVWGGLMAAGTWMIASLRQSILEMFVDMDEDDSLGLQKMLLVAEGGWTITLTTLLFFLPIVALMLAGLTLLGLWLARKWFERREERSKVACAHCNNPMFPMALFCPHCRMPNETPRQVGVFGQARRMPAGDLTAHRLELTARKRCPGCATRLPNKAIRQSCTACGTCTFNDVSELNVYLRALDKKLPMTLVICGALGFIPLVGLVPGIIYYRLSLISSLRAYIPTTVGCFTRWGLRIATMVLIAMQPLFGAGAITVPLMALMNFVVYRQVLRAGMGGLPPAAPAGGSGVPFGGAVTAGVASGMPIPATPSAPPPAAANPPVPPPAPPPAATNGDQVTRVLSDDAIADVVDNNATTRLLSDDATADVVNNNATTQLLEEEASAATAEHEATTQLLEEEASAATAEHEATTQLLEEEASTAGTDSDAPAAREIGAAAGRSCPNCQKVMNAGHRFCSACGTLLG